MRVLSAALAWVDVSGLGGHISTHDGSTEGGGTHADAMLPEKPVDAPRPSLVRALLMVLSRSNSRHTTPVPTYLSKHCETSCWTCKQMSDVCSHECQLRVPFDDPNTLPINKSSAYLHHPSASPKESLPVVGLCGWRVLRAMLAEIEGGRSQRGGVKGEDGEVEGDMSQKEKSTWQFLGAQKRSLNVRAWALKT